MSNNDDLLRSASRIDLSASQDIIGSQNSDQVLEQKLDQVNEQTHTVGINTIRQATTKATGVIGGFIKNVKILDGKQSNLLKTTQIAQHQSIALPKEPLLDPKIARGAEMIDNEIHHLEEELQRFSKGSDKYQLTKEKISNAKRRKNELLQPHREEVGAYKMLMAQAQKKMKSIQARNQLEAGALKHKATAKALEANAQQIAAKKEQLAKLTSTFSNWDQKTIQAMRAKYLTELEQLYQEKESILASSPVATSSNPKAKEMSFFTSTSSSDQMAPLKAEVERLSLLVDSGINAKIIQKLTESIYSDGDFSLLNGQNEDVKHGVLEALAQRCIEKGSLTEVGGTSNPMLVLKNENGLPLLVFKAQKPYPDDTRDHDIIKVGCPKDQMIEREYVAYRTIHEVMPFGAPNVPHATCVQLPVQFQKDNSYKSIPGDLTDPREDAPPEIAALYEPGAKVGLLMSFQPSLGTVADLQILAGGKRALKGMENLRNELNEMVQQHDGALGTPFPDITTFVQSNLDRNKYGAFVGVDKEHQIDEQILDFKKYPDSRLKQTFDNIVDELLQNSSIPDDLGDLLKSRIAEWQGDQILLEARGVPDFIEFKSNRQIPKKVLLVNSIANCDVPLNTDVWASPIINKAMTDFNHQIALTEKIRVIVEDALVGQGDPNFGGRGVTEDGGLVHFDFDITKPDTWHLRTPCSWLGDPDLDRPITLKDPDPTIREYVRVLSNRDTKKEFLFAKALGFAPSPLGDDKMGGMAEHIAEAENRLWKYAIKTKKTYNQVGAFLSMNDNNADVQKGACHSLLQLCYKAAQKRTGGPNNFTSEERYEKALWKEFDKLLPQGFDMCQVDPNFADYFA